MSRDHHARLVEALRAIADLPEHAAPGAVPFWLGEVERLVGWTVRARPQGLEIVAGDGRTWSGLTLQDLARLLAQIGDT